MFLEVLVTCHKPLCDLAAPRDTQAPMSHYPSALAWAEAQVAEVCDDPATRLALIART
jgi:hypothetical protein